MIKILPSLSKPKCNYCTAIEVEKDGSTCEACKEILDNYIPTTYNTADSQLFENETVQDLFGILSARDAYNLIARHIRGAIENTRPSLVGQRLSRRTINIVRENVQEALNNALPLGITGTVAVSRSADDPTTMEVHLTIDTPTTFEPVEHLDIRINMVEEEE